jgi:hypothetical protein
MIGIHIKFFIEIDFLIKLTQARPLTPLPLRGKGVRGRGKQKKVNLQSIYYDNCLIVISLIVK